MASGENGMNLPEVYNDRPTVPQAYIEETPFFRESDDQITFSYLFAMMRRRISVLVSTVVICTLLGLIWTMASPQVYTATSDVVLITNQADLVPGNADFEQLGRVRDEDIQTQIQLISSSAMAEQVINELDLANDAEFRGELLQPRSAWDNIKSSLGLDRDLVATAEPNEQRFLERAAGYLQRSLEVSRVGSSFNLQFAVSDSDPTRAAQISNAYARIFTTDDARQRAARNATAAQVLGERLEELREQANSDFAAVQAYRVRNGLISSSATSLSEQEISTYNQQIASARAEAARAAQALASARSQLASGGADNVGEGTSSSVVSALRSRRSQLSLEEADLARRYLDRHPELITVREQIASIDTQIAAEIGRELKALEAASQVANQRLNSLLSSRATTRGQLSGDNTALVQLTDLEREAESSQALYQSYLERYNEIMAGSGAEQPNARLIELATPPGFPVSPNWPLMIALSVAVGAVLGCLLAILTEIAYSGLTTLDDVETRLGLRTLGSVPAYRSIKPHASSPLDTVTDYPDGPFAESLRSILVSIGKASKGRCEVIALSSAIPGEGKTTLAACLGRTISMAHQSVVVVDCDIIRSQLSRMFDLNNGEDGLAEALADPAGTYALFQDGDSGMRILPISKPFRKGERLTEGGRLHQVVASLREQFDFVILDCPPILPIAEAREIVSLADQVVITVNWRKTQDKVVKSAIKQLPMRTLSKTGVALNRVDMRKQVRFGGSDAASFYKHYEAYYG